MSGNSVGTFNQSIMYISESTYKIIREWRNCHIFEAQRFNEELNIERQWKVVLEQQEGNSSSPRVSLVAPGHPQLS